MALTAYSVFTLAKQAHTAKAKKLLFYAIFTEVLQNFGSENKDLKVPT